ncbi:DUF1382 family protein [Pseudocitrobacter faecalis]|uniref:DUF1382 family protein n=1 Tax=Pseudocitrobacter faecalis TaxID=1398493 RepID=UPI0040632B56
MNRASPVDLRKSLEIANHLGITLNRFYYLAQRYSLKTAFVYKRWNQDDDHQLIEMANSGTPIKQIAEIMGRGKESVKSRLRTLRSISRNSSC